MKLIILITTAALLSTSICQAQIKNAKTAIVKVYGNCGMCETTIEKAANKNKMSKADWNKDTKMATITYDSKKTNLDAVLKNIALAGYDNQSFLAPDEAYNKLPGCCKYDREEKQMAIVMPPFKDTTTSMQNNTDHQHDGITNTAQEPNHFKEVFSSYFAVKDALVKSDATMATAKAKDLQNAIKEVKMNDLSMDVHTVWMKVLKDITKDAAIISESNVIAKQRESFISLSKNMYDLIKIAKPDETVYYQHCPMANYGKGADWLSKESEIKNPYYGAIMLSCGSMVETIK